jgi:ABC-type branched-subunit amino acid transport system ATPase component/ABC-type branched-subunit amino acid transport system permease subunit
MNTPARRTLAVPGSLRLISAVVVIAILLMAAPTVLSLNMGAINIATLVLGYAIEGCAVQFLYGMAGSLSMAHATLGGVAGYAFVILTAEHNVNAWLAILCGVALAVVTAFLLGAPAIRLQGRYFIITTFAFAELGSIVATNWLSLSNGATGITSSGIADLGVISLIARVDWYRAVLVIFALTVVILSLLKGAKFGRRLTAVRENPDLAQSIGINVPRERLVAFALSGVIVAFGGMALAGYQQYITPSNLDSTAGVQLVMIVLIGGSQYILGPLLGAVVVIWLPTVLPLSPTQDQILLGCIFVAVILAFPRGLLGLLSDLWQAANRSLRGQPAVVFEAVPTQPAQPARAAAPAGAGKGSWQPAAESTDSAAAVVPVLRCAEIDRRFAGIHALDSVSLSVNQGETLGLIGPNGSGKTTLINVFSGFVAPSSGQVFLGERRITREPAYRRARAGLLRTFQEVVVFPDLTVGDHLRIALESARAHRKDDDKGAVWTAADLAGYCRIGHRLHSPGRQLSWGEVRLLGVAMCLAMRPRVLLLDEPFAGLSLAAIERVADVIRRMTADGYSICIVDHQLDHLLPLCGRSVVFHNGSVVFDGAPADAVQHDLVLNVYVTPRAAR